MYVLYTINHHSIKAGKSAKKPMGIGQTVGLPLHVIHARFK
jgi:hypothetical protein